VGGVAVLARPQERIMKSDTELQREVQEALNHDPSLLPAEIGVSVHEGVVTLSGHVESYPEKWAAERAANRVEGVRAVAEEIEVKLPGSRERTDAQIGDKVARVLEWDTWIPEADIDVRVEHGWVTLDGSVRWEYQRDAAERAVRYLTGVKGISNRITVSPSTFGPRGPGPNASEVKQRILAALRHSADVNARQITVETRNGEVILRGAVRSWLERQDAERAAWDSPGVSRVEDLIEVRP
jgi:osmotically-inducible protein OsmY